jgi:hypothetical protein
MIEHRQFLAKVLLAAVLGGCGSDDEPDAIAEDPAEHACEHVTVVGTTVEAAPERSAAPTIAISESPYTVELVTSGPGYLRIQGPLEALLFVGTADVLNALYHADAIETELPEASPNEFCASEIPEHFDLDLHETDSFYLELGPAAVPRVWLLLSSAVGHAHQ